MKAVLLNSGIGKRMRPFTYDNPKCLAKINADTILEHEIKNLLHYGIWEIIITMGPFEEKIRDLVKKRFPEVNAVYIMSDKPDSTNYIYSMWLARDLLNDDLILMHGDMVFEKDLLGRLINSEHKNCVLVNNKIKVPEKDFKGRIKEGIVKEIGVNVFGQDAFFLAPVYKLSKNSITKWMQEIEKFVQRGELTVYAENAFNNISGTIKLYPLYYQEDFCMEIDNFEDLETAREFFSQSLHD